MIFIAMVRTLGKLVLFAASTAFIVGVTMLLLGAWLTTYPLHRQSPRKRQIQASVEFAASAANLAGVLGERLQAAKEDMENE